MFEAYITNTALYPMMGIEVGTTVHFPTTTQEVQAALAKIGIVNIILLGSHQFTA